MPETKKPAEESKVNNIERLLLAQSRHGLRKSLSAQQFNTGNTVLNIEMRDALVIIRSVNYTYWCLR